MKSAFTFFAAFSLCLATSIPTYAKGKNKGHAVLGELTKVEENSITFIKPRKGDGKEHTITIKEDTSFEVNGAKGSLADLKTGMMVIVDVNEKDKTAYSVTVKEKKKGKKKKKKITESNF